MKRTINVSGGRWVTARRDSEGRLEGIQEHLSELEAAAAKFRRGEGFLIRFVPKEEAKTVPPIVEKVAFPSPLQETQESPKETLKELPAKVSKPEKKTISEKEYMKAIESGKHKQSDFRFVTYRVSRSGFGASKPAQFEVCKTLKAAKELSELRTKESAESLGEKGWRYDTRIQMNDYRGVNGGVRPGSGAKPRAPEVVLSNRISFHGNQSFVWAFSNFIEDYQKKTAKTLTSRQAIVTLYGLGIEDNTHPQPSPEDAVLSRRVQEYAVRLTDAQFGELWSKREANESRQALMHRTLWSGLVSWYREQGGEPDAALRIRASE